MKNGMEKILDHLHATKGTESLKELAKNQAFPSANGTIPGLTKKEHYTLEILKAMIAGQLFTIDPDPADGTPGTHHRATYVGHAIDWADELITQLGG